MVRFNTFKKIHKGLRYLMFDTSIRAQQTDFMNEAECLALVHQIEEMLALFESHARNEDHYLLAPVTKFDHVISQVFEAEHEEDHQLGDDLKQSLLHWEQAQTSMKRFVAGEHLLHCLNEFIAFNVRHMNKEEDILNKVLWQHFTDDEIKLFEQEIIQNTPPEKMRLYAVWMVRALSNPEITTWLREVKQHAPPPVYEMLVNIIKQELPTRSTQLLAVPEYAL